MLRAWWQKLLIQRVESIYKNQANMPMAGFVVADDAITD